MTVSSRYRLAFAGAMLALIIVATHFYSARFKQEPVINPSVSALDATEPVLPADPATAALPAEHSVIASDWQNLTEPTGVAFKNWTERYTKTTASEEAAWVAEGIPLAEARRARLSELIAQNPEKALTQAVPIAVRKGLPAEILALLESRISGVGSITHRLATPRKGRKISRKHTRHAYVNSQSYQAYTYGRRARMSYLEGISISGIAVDRKLAVSDSPVRLLEPGESTATGGPRVKCDTPAGKAANVEIKGSNRSVCCAKHLGSLSARLTADEGLLLTGAAGPNAEGGGPTYAWTHGPKKVLIVRLEFTDVPGAPIGDDGKRLTQARAVELINGANKTKEFFEKSSYGQTTLVLAPLNAGVSPDVTSLIMMPRTLQSYASGPDPGNVDAMYQDSKIRAQRKGYLFDNYDRIVLTFSNGDQFSNSTMAFGGLANSPGAVVWLNGAFDLSFCAHEIGHNYGLNHASRWIVRDGNPISAAGEDDEYGDLFDMMGSGEDSTHDFSPWCKKILQWLPPTAITTATQSGIYRVHRFDSEAANLTNKLVLKIPRNSEQDYWISYRGATSNPSLESGAYVMWGANEAIKWNADRYSRGLLLDMTTPGDTLEDCALGVGQAFNDVASGVRFKTVTKGGTGVDEYLDIQVIFNNATTAYQTWRDAKFTPLEMDDLTISGDLVDPDHDGIVNFLEFALNLPPKAAGLLGSPSHSVLTVDNRNYLTLTFRRQLAAPELTYLPQTSSSLSGTWMSDATQIGSSINNNDGTETVTYRDSVPLSSANKRFMRLRVVLTP